MNEQGMEFNKSTLEVDKEGRTREDIMKASKSLKKEVLDSITFKDGEFFIEGKPADEWIAEDEGLHGKDRYWD